MASLYQTTTNSSARDAKHTKQVSLNADVEVPYENNPRQRQTQKKVSCRLAKPAYKNLSNHQHAAFEGFKLGLFGKASTLPEGPKAGASGSKCAKDRADDGKSSKTIIEKYYNLVKGPANEDYEDTLTTQHMQRHKNQISLSSQAAANLQTLSPRMSEGFYLRKEVAFSSPQQSISKSGTSNYMLKNRYNKVMDAGSMYGTAPAGRGDRTRTIRSSLHQRGASGRGGRQLQKEGLQVDVNGLGAHDLKVMSGPSSRRALEAMKASAQQ